MTFFSNDMWHLAVPLAEKIVRPLVVYVFLVACLRWFGKRQLAQLNPFDLVVLLTLSNTVQNAIIGNDNSVSGGLIGALSLLTVNYLTVRFLFSHPKVEQMMEGRPTTLIEHGKLRSRALAGELMTSTELRTVAHRQGFRTLDEIERCVLEPGGNFYLEGKNPAREEVFRREVLARLDRMAAQLEAR